MKYVNSCWVCMLSFNGFLMLKFHFNCTENVLHTTPYYWIDFKSNTLRNEVIYKHWHAQTHTDRIHLHDTLSWGSILPFQTARQMYSNIFFSIEFNYIIIEFHLIYYKRFHSLMNSNSNNNCERTHFMLFYNCGHCHNLLIAFDWYHDCVSLSFGLEVSRKDFEMKFYAISLKYNKKISI